MFPLRFALYNADVSDAMHPMHRRALALEALLHLSCQPLIDQRVARCATLGCEGATHEIHTRVLIHINTPLCVGLKVNPCELR